MGNDHLPSSSSEMDYNAEIPFQKEIPRGYYDISAEITDTPIRRFTGDQVNILEHNSRVAAEQRQRRNDMHRFNQLTQENLPAAMMQLNRLTPAGNQKRPKLQLPSPAVSEKELRELL